MTTRELDRIIEAREGIEQAIADYREGRLTA